MQKSNLIFNRYIVVKHTHTHTHTHTHSQTNNIKVNRCDDSPLKINCMCLKHHVSVRCDVRMTCPALSKQLRLLTTLTGAHTLDSTCWTHTFAVIHLHCDSIFCPVLKRSQRMWCDWPSKRLLCKIALSLHSIEHFVSYNCSIDVTWLL